ncbi:YbhB/YbcL family Raf kinase inhibitor-like protein [Mucilaginibacter sp. SP1R1]|uniref:YbhB/YbcL family Raf kinase inhibitor-like protein n=1 Tax=Mucilaginibacter sp. SP1R1 TaxID=2723091 RepID=UPI00160D9854|nr:YbhB/YbcL family Raf kinase inhibitor-like protein [Mucilaginibacter sp. SP1R1]MBB6147997.1 hypothetical protein [Mucilaginibacter sp. SP1R1]
MKKIILQACFLLLTTSAIAQKTFTLASSNLEGQATLNEEFNGNGYNGKNRSPHLSWTNAPQGTKSFAITMYDPDAPTGSGWWHWIIFDVPADVHELADNAGSVAAHLAPKMAIQSLTDFGLRGYGGPCPPAGTGIHQYIITIYALKTAKLGLDESVLPPNVGFTLKQNMLAKASLIFYDQHP